MLKAAWVGTMRPPDSSSWSDHGSISTGWEQPDPYIYIYIEKKIARLIDQGKVPGYNFIFVSN